MDPAQFVPSIIRDGAAFRTACVVAGLDAPVASCPGWTVADLLRHVADVHYFWGSLVAQRATSGRDVARPERINDDALFDAYDARLARMIEVLTASDPATEVWTWSADHSVGFVVRRMAQELAIHRWDAERVMGEAVPIEGSLASDGIDEFLEHFLPDVVEGSAPVEGSVHIHCGDVAGEWTVRPAPNGYDVTREHAKGDCALRGAASDLLLVLWRRLRADAIDVVGDARVAARFLAATNLD